MNNSVAIQKLKWKSADNETLEEDMGLKLMLVEESNENMEIEENSNPELRTMTFSSKEKYVDVCTWDGD